MPIATINPATGETVETFTPLTGAQVEEKLARAASAFARHRRTPVADRAARMARAGNLFDAEKESIARIVTLEMGKTLREAVAEAEKCARACRFYADHAARFLADEPLEAQGARAFVRPLPLGPILAIMPWNFPLWQVIRFAAPALVAGNVGLLKHAENVPRCALLLEDVFRRAGFGPGVFQALLVETGQVAAIIDDPRVVAATLTGSERAGMAVAERAGKNLKKTVLELGGSDPFIVMPSADIALSAQTAVRARTLNSGQSCIAAKRFLVHEDIADEWTRLFVAGMEALKVGDPLDAETDIGPLAMPRLLDGLEDQVRRSVEAGARLLTGGARLNRPGNFYTPTVLADIPPAAPAYHEELFGPVALLFRVRDIDQAVSLANDTPFGLGSSVWTGDDGERERFIDEIEAGQTFFNGMVASDPALPFGGVKRSGYGRELSSHGLREFVNLKTVWMVSEGKADTKIADTE